MTTFNKVRIGDLMTWAKGCNIPRDDTSADGNIPYLHYGDLYKKYDGCLNLPDVLDDIIKIDNLGSVKDSQMLHDGDIVFTLTSETVDDLGHCTLIINPDDVPFVSGMETTILHLKMPEKALPKYLNYVFQTERFRKILRQYVTGMKVYRVHPKDMMNIEMDLPSVNEQNKIVGILDSFSDSISNLIKINDNLVNQLKTRYQRIMDFTECSDLIDSEFGPIPKDWHIEQVSKYCQCIRNGATPNRSVDDYWTNGTIPWVVTGEVKDSIILDTTEKISESGLKNSSAVLLPIDTIIMAMYGRGTAARLAYLKTEATTNQACCGMVCSTPNRSAFLYITLHQMHDYIESLASGSVQQNLSKDIIESLSFICPPDEFIESINFSSIISVMTINEKKISKLIELRDCLLPKLMSGEIDISSLELPTKYSFSSTDE